MESNQGLSQHTQVGGRTPVAEPRLAPTQPHSGDVARRDGVRRRRPDRFWRDARRRRLLAIADIGAAATASLFAFATTGATAWVFALLPGWVLIAKLLGLYDRDQGSIRHLTIDELPAIAAWGAAGTAMLGLVASTTALGTLVLVWLVATVAAGFMRGAARWLWRRITPPELTAVLGDGDLAAAARRKVELFTDMHLSLVAGGGLSLAGSNDDRATALRPLVRRLDRVVLAMEKVDPKVVGQLAGICREEQVKLSVISPLRGRAGAAPRLSEVGDLPVLEYDTRDPSRSTMLLKGAFDVVVSACALLVTAPFLVLMAIAIRLDSSGPVIFTQLRAGRAGKPFRMYKLRTMTADAERELAGVVSIEDLPEPMFKLRLDPRVTRIGRLLRRFSLDELPQLVNVLRGEMSIVGPRPEQIELVKRYQPEHRFRLDVKPGMTGPMQVYGRGDLDFTERLAVELDYVENLSLARDLRILFQTVPVVLRGNGAY